MPDLPLGPPVEWAGAPRPVPTQLRGDHVLLRPIDPAADAEPLFTATLSPDGSRWAYLFFGPFEDVASLRRRLEQQAASDTDVFFTIETQAAGPVGIGSYMRIDPANGCVEIGNLCFGDALQRTTASTEAIFLMARHAFDELGYRRLEWKCNALNAPSRAAAERFGFEFDGVFRNHMVVKGRNRDTAWYSIVAEDWPAIRGAFERWLSPSNFGGDGRQRQSLRALTTAARQAVAG